MTMTREEILKKYKIGASLVNTPTTESANSVLKQSTENSYVNKLVQQSSTAMNTTSFTARIVVG